MVITFLLDFTVTVPSMNPEDYKQILKNIHIDPLCDLKVGYTDVYGVIKKSFDMKQSTKGDMDWKVTLYVADPTYGGVNITILLFHKDRQTLIKFKENAIILLKGVVVKEFNNKMQVIVSSQKKVALFSPGSDQPETISFQDCSLDEDDHTIVRYLHKWNIHSIKAGSSHALPKTGRQYVEVKDLEEDRNRYVDFVGQVVDLRQVGEKQLELTVTDYTENPHPAAYLEERDNLQIGTSFLILCGLWDENAENCPELNPGDYVSLTNCKKKIKNPLELNIHGDSENKQRVMKLEADDARLEKVIMRQMNHSNNVPRKKRFAESFQSYDLETNLLTEFDKATDITTILNERAPSKRYKILAYVKDYKPKNIKDWIIGWCSNCHKSNAAGRRCEKCQQPTEYSYKFSLLVNDGSGAELILYGFGDEALKLFPSFTPEQVVKNDTLFKIFEKIINLACNEEQQHFEMALETYLVEGQNFFNYQIVETQFVLHE